MRTPSSLLALALAAPLLADTAPPPPPPVRSVGTDVTVFTISDAFHYGTQTVDGLLVHSLGVGTDCWNMGDRPMPWWNTGADVADHPVIAQSLYRAAAGGARLDQVGISWGKHGTVPANGNSNPQLGLCSSSGLPSRTLGVNCSDLYGSGLNAAQGILGPRFDVDPITGGFTYPYTGLVGTYTTSTQPAARRVQVPAADLIAGAVYYAEAQFVHPEDALWNNARNNFGVRRLAPFVPITAVGNVPFNAVTYPRTTALELFAGENPALITLRTLDYLERTVTFTDKWRPWTPQAPTTPLLPQAQWTTVTNHIHARYQLAASVTDHADGTFTYTYMLLNLNSHRAVSSLALRLPHAAAVTAHDFKAPRYHSGDRVLNNPWLFSTTPLAARFSVDPATAQVLVPGMAAPVTFEPNFLRWGTLYTYSLRVNAPPTTGAIRLTLHRPFTGPVAAIFTGDTLAVTGLPVPAVCLADVGAQGGIAAPDGLLDNNDFIVFIDAFFTGNLFLADLGAPGGVNAPDNQLDNNDFIVYINEFFAACT